LSTPRSLPILSQSCRYISRRKITEGVSFLQSQWSHGHDRSSFLTCL
jgi:hypothetical protein